MHIYTCFEYILFLHVNCITILHYLIIRDNTHLMLYTTLGVYYAKYLVNIYIFNKALATQTPVSSTVLYIHLYFVQTDSKKLTKRKSTFKNGLACIGIYYTTQPTAIQNY